MKYAPPTPRPCASCPYRRDVPPGIWDRSEYEKLPGYDEPTMFQPHGVFLCHQHDPGADNHPVCGGWAGCHDGDELLALRLAIAQCTMTVEAVEAVRDYVSPVPLFASGAEAAEHGMAHIEQPTAKARTAIAKIARTRNNLWQGESK